MPDPILLVHGGAGPARGTLTGECEAALHAALERGAAALADGGDALAAVQAAVSVMEDEADVLNAGRGAVLCADGTAELSAAAMRGGDRAAGAVALLRRTRSPVAAAVALLHDSPHVLLAGAAADTWAADHGLEQCDPEYFVTGRQRARLHTIGSDFAEAGAGAGDAHGTVGAVCRDGEGRFAAATSTGGRRGQLPGRIGDTPLIGAGTWADPRIAVSCTGDGEAFVRVAAAHQLASRIAAGEPLAAAAAAVLADVAAVGGTGGLIAVDAGGATAMPFTTEAMNRGIWRAGAEPQVGA